MNQNGSSGSGSKHTTVGSSVGVNNGVNNKTLDNEKRMRREIANSNERRRMQSINAGFQNLRSLLPRHEGEKLSKVSILFWFLIVFNMKVRRKYYSNKYILKTTIVPHLNWMFTLWMQMFYLCIYRKWKFFVYLFCFKKRIFIYLWQFHRATMEMVNAFTQMTIFVILGICVISVKIL